MTSVIMLSVTPPSIIILNAAFFNVMLSVIVPSLVLLSVVRSAKCRYAQSRIYIVLLIVVMPNVVVLSVVAPLQVELQPMFKNVSIIEYPLP